jgi:hypothetical protein
MAKEIKNNEFKSLSKEELELRKLQNEVIILQKQIDDANPDKINTIQKCWEFIKKNMAQISAVIVLIGTIYNPIINYIASQHKAQQINVGNNLWKILDTPITNDKKLLEISTQDPAILAPIVLGLLNDSSINLITAKNLYVRMYDNTDFYNQSVYDKFLSLFIKDNKSILEEELCRNAKKVFNYDISNSDSLLNIITTYIDIIFQLRFQNKSEFIELFEILKSKCNSCSASKSICKYLYVAYKNNK